MFPIADVAERWENGTALAAFLDAAKIGRESIQTMLQTVALDPADRAAFAAMRAPLRALIVTEDWCPDSALNLPVLIRIAEAHPALDLRFVGREPNWDLLAHARKGDRMAIPTIFFFDPQWDLQGYWVERSAAVDALLTDFETGRTPPADPDRTSAAWLAYRAARSAYYRDELMLKRALWRETVAELREVLSGKVISNVPAQATAG